MLHPAQKPKEPIFQRGVAAFTVVSAGIGHPIRAQASRCGFLQTAAEKHHIAETGGIEPSGGVVGGVEDLDAIVHSHRAKKAHAAVLREIALGNRRDRKGSPRGGVSGRLIQHQILGYQSVPVDLLRVKTVLGHGFHLASLLDQGRGGVSGNQLHFDIQVRRAPGAGVARVGVVVTPEAKANRAEARRAIQRAELAIEEARQGGNELKTRVAGAKLEVERIQSQIDAGRLYAPFDGKIASIDVRPGDAVQAYKAVISVMNDRSLRLWLIISAARMRPRSASARRSS